MGRAHAVAAVIEDAAGQQGLGLHPAGPVVGDLFIQLGLDGNEQGPIENGGLFPFEDFPLEGDLSDIEAIAKQIGERSPRKRDAPYSLPTGCEPWSRFPAGADRPSAG